MVEAGESTRRDGRLMTTNAWRTSLRCLVQPATLFSIGLLLLNDHVLKSVAPSWFTGKLSDFAGLFFFPFLLAAVLSLLLAPVRRLSPVAVGRIAFVVTGVWFALAKATPAGHALTVGVASAFLGHPVSVVPDATDLLALVVLWPAWRLWRTQAGRAHRGTSARDGLVALVLAGLAGIATSPPVQELAVRFVVAENELYLLTKSGPAYDLPERGVWRLYRTPDNGRTWTPVDPIPRSLAGELDRPLPPEVVVEQPDNPQVQYRVQGEERVEYSEDGGQTWRTVWKIPAGRRQFMQRYRTAGLLPGPPVMLGPYDLAFTPDGSGTLVVAAGTEGVLVRSPTGEWSRHAVGMAGPTPLSTPYPSQWLSILLFPEGLLLVGFTILASVVLSIIGWVPILRARRRARGGQAVMRVLRPAVVSVTLALVLVISGYVVSTASIGGNAALILLFAVFLLPPVLVAFALLYSWSRVIRVAQNETEAAHSRRGCVGTTVALLVAGALPFVLWAAGIVSRYSFAALVAVVFTLAVTVAGAVRVYRLSRAAAG